MRANNRKLTEEVVNLRTQGQQLQAELAETKAAIEDLKNFNTEIAKTNAKTRKAELLTAIREAKTDGNTELEVELIDQLSELNGQIKESAKAPEVKPKPVAQAQTITPVMKDWLAANPWFGTDKRKTGYAFGVAEELKAKGLEPGTKDFYAEMDVEIDKQFASNGRRQNVSKVEGSSGEGGSTSGTKSYADLPPDAKEACEKLAPKFIGKAFKDAAAWRAHYVSKYFQE
jgi:hypothetical protein